MLYKSVKYLFASILSVPLLYGAWLLTRMCVMDYFTIPTESMSPTLLPGDKVIVYKIKMGARIYTDLNFNVEGQELKCFRTKGTRLLKHNDIVVFNFPHHDWKIRFVINNVFCKRIVALPGDSLCIENGYYKNNNYEDVLGLESQQGKLYSTPDSMIWQPALNTIPFDEHFPWTIKKFGPMYIPRKGDLMDITPKEARLYQMLLEWELGKKVEYDWETNKVWAGRAQISRHKWKHNYYFMAGDNVMDSNDSRYWGLVPEEYIIGTVVTIVRNRKFIAIR